MLQVLFIWKIHETINDGMINNESRNIARILIEATVPNSFSTLLSVRIKVANPEGSQVCHQCCIPNFHDYTS